MASRTGPETGEGICALEVEVVVEDQTLEDFSYLSSAQKVSRKLFHSSKDTECPFVGADFYTPDSPAWPVTVWEPAEVSLVPESVA